jgi:hypothetical protein
MRLQRGLRRRALQRRQCAQQARRFRSRQNLDLAPRRAQQ